MVSKRRGRGVRANLSEKTRISPDRRARILAGVMSFRCSGRESERPLKRNRATLFSTYPRLTPSPGTRHNKNTSRIIIGRISFSIKSRAIRPKGARRRSLLLFSPRGLYVASVPFLTTYVADNDVSVSYTLPRGGGGGETFYRRGLSRPSSSMTGRVVTKRSRF